VENAPCEEGTFSSNKQPGRVHKEEKKLCKLPFLFMLINPGVLAHNIKGNKIKPEPAPSISSEIHTRL
jgi:hypothetical protein